MNKRAAFSGFIGNALEFYDFALYGVLSGLFTKIFFPNSDASSLLFSGIGVFSMGLVARPLGGLIFGYIGDRYSRRTALSLSMYLMAIPSLIITLLPTYAVIGTLAPVLLIAARILQGICTGGEYNGAAIFAIEHQKVENKGLVSGMMTASTASGLVLATLVSYIFTTQSLPEWAWRIPFLFGVLIAAFGYYIRRKNLESPDFQKFLNQKNKLSIPIVDAFKHHRFAILTTIFIAGQTAVLGYMMFTLITPSSPLSQLHLFSRDQIYLLGLIGLVTFAVMCVISGYLSDQVPISKEHFIMLSAVVAIVLIIPIFSMLLSGVFYLAVIGQLLFGFVIGLHAGPQHLYMQELFPQSNRYSAVSFSFSLGTGIFGGITPQLSVYLIQKFGHPSLWVIMTSVSLFACLLLHRVLSQRRLGITHHAS